jgi:hypothetical protein
MTSRVIYAAFTELECAAELTALVLIAASGVHKLLRLSSKNLFMWRPKWIPAGEFSFVIAIVAVTEIGVAIMTVASDHELRTIIQMLLILLYVVLTGYAYLSISRTGQCGCHGDALSDTARSKPLQMVTVFARNSALFGLAYCASQNILCGAGGRWAIENSFELSRRAQLASLGFVLAQCANVAIHRAKGGVSPGLIPAFRDFPLVDGNAP